MKAESNETQYPSSSGFIISCKQLTVINIPLRGRGILGSGWQRQNCVTDSLWPCAVDFTGLDDSERSAADGRSRIGIVLMEWVDVGLVGSRAVEGLDRSFSALTLDR